MNKGVTIKDILELLVLITGWQVQASEEIVQLKKRVEELEELATEPDPVLGWMLRKYA